MEYSNVIMNIATERTPDPYVIRAHGKYFMLYTARDKIEMWASESLVNMQHDATRHKLWEPPSDTKYSEMLWAPELHAIRGRWYIYFAAQHPKHGNKSHRMYVLGGPNSELNPATGHWEFLGPVKGTDHHWSIDGHVFELHNELYFVYSGWPRDAGDSELHQELYMCRLSDPTTASTEPVAISHPERNWERTHSEKRGEYAIQEGPHFVRSTSTSWSGIVYSCSGAWTKDYKMAVLHYRGGDPLRPGSWQKDERPLLQAARGDQGPWGPGHASFLELDGEMIAIYHAKDKKEDGFDDRKARMQRVVFKDNGPYMGDYVGPVATELKQFVQGSRHPERLRLLLKSAAA